MPLRVSAPNSEDQNFRPLPLIAHSILTKKLNFLLRQRLILFRQISMHRLISLESLIATNILTKPALVQSEQPEIRTLYTLSSVCHNGVMVESPQ